VTTPSCECNINKNTYTPPSHVIHITEKKVFFVLIFTTTHLIFTFNVLLSHLDLIVGYYGLFWTKLWSVFKKKFMNLYLAVSWEQFMSNHHQACHLASIYYPPNLILHLCTFSYLWRIFGILKLKHCYHGSKKSIWCIITKHYNFFWYISLHAWFVFEELWPTFNEPMNGRC